MKSRRIIALITSVLLAFCLCGCDMLATPTEELIAPPELTGDMRPIAEALSASTNGVYTLRYPSEGEHRSAIILEDIDTDGFFEAFAFYSTVVDETTAMHINLICQENGIWDSAADYSIAAIGVERVAFCDFDGDGTEEIVVGWEIYGSSEKQLTVFSFNNGVFSQRLQQQYTGFLCGDLDNNGENEMFIHNLNTSEGTNKASVYSFDDSGTQQIAGCLMDSTVKTASEPMLLSLSTGQPAIYIDEIKGIGAITEVLYLSKGELKNPLLDIENAFENTTTLRAASLSCQDINNDGIMEIPVTSDLPSADGSSEGLYYTNWCSFNGENLNIRQITIVNSIDGYYLTVPNRMVGKIAVSKDTDNHRRVVYAYDSETATVGERIFTISAIDTSLWEDDGYDRRNMVEIYRLGEVVFAVSLNSTQKEFNVTIEEITEMFSMIEQ